MRAPATASPAAAAATGVRCLADPPPRSNKPGFLPGGHGLVGQPVLDLVGQGTRRRIPIVRAGAHRLLSRRPRAPRHPRVDLARRLDFAAPGAAEHRVLVVLFDRRPAGDEVVERRPQAVDVAGLSRRVAFGLLGAHVGNRAQDELPAGSYPTLSARGPERRLLASAGVSGPSTSLAIPQSTTSVSPYGPSRMFAGLRSRWSTPRLWA